MTLRKQEVRSLNTYLQGYDDPIREFTHTNGPAIDALYTAVNHRELASPHPPTPANDPIIKFTPRDYFHPEILDASVKKASFDMWSKALRTVF